MDETTSCSPHAGLGILVGSDELRSRPCLSYKVWILTQIAAFPN